MNAAVLQQQRPDPRVFEVKSTHLALKVSDATVKRIMLQIIRGWVVGEKTRVLIGSTLKFYSKAGIWVRVQVTHVDTYQCAPDQLCSFVVEAVFKADQLLARLQESSRGKRQLILFPEESQRLEQMVIENINQWENPEWAKLKLQK